MLIFCDFIQVFVFTTNHHLNYIWSIKDVRDSGDIGKILFLIVHVRR